MTDIAIILIMVCLTFGVVAILLLLLAYGLYLGIFSDDDEED